MSTDPMLAARLSVLMVDPLPGIVGIRPSKFGQCGQCAGSAPAYRNTKGYLVIASTWG